ncbi:MAG: hypothetical protein IIA09_18660 [Proteobacteria bacterium]|nr:hypothetical protein [Pseudomonadota bacterium]
MTGVTVLTGCSRIQILLYLTLLFDGRAGPLAAQGSQPVQGHRCTTPGIVFSKQQRRAGAGR